MRHTTVVQYGYKHLRVSYYMRSNNFCLQITYGTHQYLIHITKIEELGIMDVIAIVTKLDVWRHLHPDPSRLHLAEARWFLVARHRFYWLPVYMASSCVSCSIVPYPFSDHDAVFLGFSIPDFFPRGPGRWKLNVSILRNPVFFQTVCDFWPR